MILYPICFLSPLLILWLTHKYSILNKLGSVVLAYAFGCLLGLSGLLPEDATTKTAQDIISSATIPLAIPLMLFSSNVRSWLKLAPNFAKSLLFGTMASIIAVVAGFYLFSENKPDIFAKIGGLLIGLYTGGTANLASLKIILDVDAETYLQVHTYSILVGAIYLMVMIIFGKRLAGLILPQFKKEDANQTDSDKMLESHEHELFYGLFYRENIKHLLRAIGYTLIVVAIGGGVAFLVPKNSFLAVFILTMSTISIAASFIPQVRNTKRTFEAGIYFILVFSIAVSSQVNIGMFYNIDATFFLYTLFVTLGALTIHILLNGIFRIDTDTTLVSSISLICSPPFVPVMASALNNRSVIGPGIAVGLIGYAVGTYIGFIVWLALS